MMRLTYTIVGRTLFSFDGGQDAEIIERAMQIILPFTFGRLERIVNWPSWIPTTQNRQFHSALNQIDQIVYRIIDQHRQGSTNGRINRDLLSLLMSVKDDETGRGLSDEQLRNETITFLLAGHETTATALTWVFYLLSQNPDAERQLQEEITTVLSGRTPGLDDLSQLPYTKAVVKESMRLYPPIWIIERRIIDADLMGGFKLPAKSTVVISPYALHRHPAFWDKPERFDPSRFVGRSPEAYFPFGAGPRFCIGNEFAMLEAQLIVAMIVQSFQLQWVPEHPIEPLAGITLRSKHGMRMTLHPRQTT